jgi:hypothetical protein
MTTHSRRADSRKMELRASVLPAAALKMADRKEFDSVRTPQPPCPCSRTAPEKKTAPGLKRAPPPLPDHSKAGLVQIELVQTEFAQAEFV